MKRFKNLNNNCAGVGGRTAAFFVLFVLSIGGTRTVFADTSSNVATSTGDVVAAVPADTCTPDASAFDAIQAIQNDPTLGYLGEIQQELAARRNLLSETLLCAKGENEALKANLLSEVTDPAFSNLKDQLSGKLDDASSYYDIQLTKVNTAGISGTEAIARDVVAWRAGTYGRSRQTFPILSFGPRIRHYSLRRIAGLRRWEIWRRQSRFPRMRSCETDFQEATVSLQAAEGENSQAKAVLEQSLSSDQALAIIQQSLASLSATYEHSLRHQQSGANIIAALRE